MHRLSTTCDRAIRQRSTGLVLQIRVYSTCRNISIVYTRLDVIMINEKGHQTERVNMYLTQLFA